MKKPNLETFGIAGLLALCCPLSAFADPYGFINCTTESNGLQFSRSERDGGLARNLSVQDCERDSRTNNNECRANLSCTDAPTLPVISCETESSGLRFTQSGRSRDLTISLAIQACQRNSRTNNDECRANIICNDGLSQLRPMISCQTESNGLNFTHADRDASLARMLAERSCEQDSRTNNDECRANTWCSDVNSYEPPSFACNTQSRGLVFGRAGKSEGLTRQLSIKACMQDPRTSNAECQVNIICSVLGQPQMQPPIYTPARPVEVLPGRPISCSTMSNGRSFSLAGMGLPQTRSRVISLCQQSPFTDKLACERAASCR